MIRGRKPKPRGRPSGEGAQAGPDALPRCPPHLSDAARREWRRLAAPLHRMGVLTVCDRAALAAYCQAYGRWVEAEERLRETPLLIRTPPGYVQQSPWLGIANRQLELMGRYMAELGLTPTARARVALASGAAAAERADKVEVVFVTRYADGTEVERRPGAPRGPADDAREDRRPRRITLDAADAAL